MDTEIVVVSGLPRSGTSLMMQMLARGGIEVMTDVIRTADVDNPHGYYELEKVKQIKQDASWLPHARGKAFKMVSQLLYELPPSERYRVIFMERDLDEMLASQEKMLARLGRPAASRESIKPAFVTHLEKLRAWLARQSHINVLYLNYSALLADPAEQAGRLRAWLGGRGDVEAMVGAVDPSLYRNRKAPGAPCDDRMAGRAS